MAEPSNSAGCPSYIRPVAGSRPTGRSVVCAPDQLPDQNIFYAPRRTATTLTLTTPRTWVVSATEVLECSLPTVGSAVTVEAAVEVSIEGLGLSDAQLQWLYENLDGALLDLLLSADPDGDVAPQLMLYSGQRAGLKNRFLEGQALASQQAALTASSLLVCKYESEAKSLTCEQLTGVAGAVASGDPVPPGLPIPVDTASFAAGAFEGDTQEQANQLRDKALEAALSCVWLNSEQTAECPLSADDPPVAVPSTPVFHPNLNRSQIGTVVVSAGEFGSIVGPDEANAAALAAAVAELDCFWVNEEFSVSCPVPDSPYAEGAGDYLNQERGSSISVPGGVIASTVSVEDANEQAEQIARSLLICRWVNSGNEIECPDVPEELEEQVYKFSGTTVSLPLGSIESFVSQEDADAQETLTAQSLLSCVYCNEAVSALCSFDDLDGTSVDRTLGASRGSICGQDMTAVIATSQSLAGVPAPPPTIADGCRFTNERIIVRCSMAFDLPEDLDTTGAILDYVDALNTDFDTERSTAYVMIEAGSVSILRPTGGSMTPQEDANNQARLLALSTLECVYSNEKHRALCGASAAVTPPATDWPLVDGWRQDGTSSGQVGNTSFEVAAGIFQSAVSLSDANIQARLLAVSTLNCYFENDPQTGSCPPGTVTISAGSVPAGVVTSTVSKTDANTQALNMANALAFCMDPDAYAAAPNGPPGPAGAPGSCTSTCTGVWG